MLERVGCLQRLSLGARRMLPGENRHCWHLHAGSDPDGFFPSLPGCRGGSRLRSPMQTWKDAVPGVPGVTAALSHGRSAAGGWLSSSAPGPARGTRAAPALSARRTSLPGFGRAWWSPCCPRRKMSPLGMSLLRAMIPGRISPCSPQGEDGVSGDSWRWSQADVPCRADLHI